MLIEIKHNDRDKIEKFIKFNSLFWREYYAPVTEKQDVSSFEMYNNLQTISN